MNIKRQWVNDKPVRYLNKNSAYWVVVCDLAVAADLSPSTLHKHINNSCSDSDKTFVGSSNACAVPVDVALSSINSLLSGDRWKRKLKVNSRFAQFATNTIAFLEELQTLADKDIFIRFVGTATKLEWVARDVVAALYPNNSKSSCHARLKVVSDKWKSKKRININGRNQEVTTIFKAGIDELIEHSNSARSQMLSEWIDKQIEFETQLENAWDDPTDDTATEIEAIIPVLTDFMGYKVRFVDTQQNPEWVANDLVCVLYPDADKRNYNQHLAKVNDDWKNKILLKTNGGVQTVVTVNEAGLRQLIARGNSEIAQYLQNKIFKGEILEFNQITEEIKEPETIVEHHFMGADICFVGTAKEPEWIVLDILQLLYPDAGEENYEDYLRQIDSQWLDRVRVYVNDEEQIFTTIYKPGLFDLIARSNSVIAQPLRKRIIEQLDFINSNNPDMTNNETDFNSEDTATQDVVTPTNFDYMGQIIRFVGTEDKPEWVAADIIDVLFSHVHKTSRYQYLAQVKDTWKNAKKIATERGDRRLLTLYKSGVLELIEQSNSPNAVDFEKWFNQQLIKVVSFDFMGYNIRSVSNMEVPEWVAADLIAVLYPDIELFEYEKCLTKINSRWLNRRMVLNVHDVEEVVTIYQPGMLKLIAESCSVIATPFRKWILKINTTQTIDNEAAESEAKADDRGNAVAPSEVNSYNEEGKIEEVTDDVVTPIDFDYMGQIIRFVGTEDKPEWVAADPVAILYPDADKRNYSNYLKKINPKWKEHKLVMTPGGPQNVTTLLEPGLWQLTARSDSPIAVPFQEWLYVDAIPSIRKKGSYTVPNAVSNMLSIANGTFSEEVEKFAQFTRDSLNTTNFPLPLKTILFVRTLREKFPDCKEFDILSQGLYCQDFSPYFKDIKFRTYHDISELAVVYADKHRITKINKISIMSALIDKNLMLKDKSGEWLPTNCGKKYCVIGWHTLPNDILMPELKWKQEVLDVIGKLH